MKLHCYYNAICHYTPHPGKYSVLGVQLLQSNMHTLYYTYGEIYLHFILTVTTNFMLYFD